MKAVGVSRRYKQRMRLFGPGRLHDLVEQKFLLPQDLGDALFERLRDQEPDDMQRLFAVEPVRAIDRLGADLFCKNPVLCLISQFCLLDAEFPPSGGVQRLIVVRTARSLPATRRRSGPTTP